MKGFNLMPMPTLEELLAAGAHFGHKKERSHPKAKQNVFTIRDSVLVIDLEKTLEGLEAALKELEKLFKEGKTILFVGTKRQAKEAVKRSAESLQMPFVTERWLGGMLTNYETISRSLKQIPKLEELIKSEEFGKYTKKEKSRIEEKLIKLLSTFGGLKEITKLPDALFIVDTAKENVAVLEARKSSIKTFGICDTNSNPDLIDFPIPANDDSEKTIGLILDSIAENLKSKVSKVKVEDVEIKAPTSDELKSQPEKVEKEEPKEKETEKKITKKVTKKTKKEEK